MATKLRCCARHIHMGRIVPELNATISRQFEEEDLNVKKLRTRRNLGLVRLPVRLEYAAQAKIRQIADTNFRKEVKELINVIYGQKLPDEKHTLALKRADIKTELELRDKIQSRPDYDPSKFVLQEYELSAKNELQKLIEGTLEDRRRDWHYYEYDEYSSNLYMATRLAPNYAVIKTIMNEIRDMDQQFQPKSVLDFGSGMGTTIWAVNETWPNSVQEFMNIDISKEQQHLCEFLLRGGKETGQPLQNVFHREYLPVSTKVRYDMVVSAFSFLDLPNTEMRAQTIENLWNKTNDILVLVERGNKGGFSTIHDARHFILDSSGFDVTKKINFTTQSQPQTQLNQPKAHILAPCPHEFACPRASMSTKMKRDICRFRVVFEPLEIGEKKHGYSREEFSYVVLRKRPYQPYYSETTSRWPRIVEKRNHAGGQITHKICCPNGTLAETVITKKKYGRAAYEVAKSCSWGDVLPIGVSDSYIKSSFIDKKTSNNDGIEAGSIDGSDKSP